MDISLEKKCFIAFVLLIIAQLIIWTLLPILILKGTYIDILENLSWGRHWEWGYDKNPYFGAWLTRLFYEFSKQGIWTAYLLSQIAIVASYYAVWRLAHYILSSRVYAFLSVSLLVAVPFYNLISPEFNDNVIEIALWALMCLYFYEALKWQKLSAWILLGIVSGLALMTKYYTGALLLPMLLFLLFTKEGRLSLRYWGFYLSLGIFFILVIPNLIWLQQHNFVAIHYALGRAKFSASAWENIYAHFTNPLLFLIELLLPLTLFILIVLVHFFFKRTASKKSLDKFTWGFLLTLSFGPILLSFLFCLITGAKYNATWEAPLFNLLGIIVIAWLHPRINFKVLRNYFSTIILVFLFWMLAYVFMQTFYPYTRTNLKTMYEVFPGKAVAAKITQQWRAKYHRPLTYVAGDRLAVVNIEMFSTDHPVGFFEWNPNFSAWIDEDDFRKKGGVFVWRIQDNYRGFPGDISKQYPTAKLQAVQIYRWAINPLFEKWLHLKQPMPLQLGIAFLPPKN